MDVLMNSTNKFLDDFKVKLPIIGLPGLGWQTPELTAAISNAGGLGTFVLGLSDEDEIESAVSRIRSLTDKPFAVLLFPPEPSLLNNRDFQLQTTALSPLREALGLVDPTNLKTLPDFECQFKKIIELEVPAIGLRLGGLREPYMEVLEEKEIPVFGLASNLRDAKVLVSSGVNAVVASGWSEAGLLSNKEIPASKAQIDSLVLWEECVRALKVPVLAAGSIMTQGQVRTAQQLGLAGFLLSDALLNATESPLPQDWKTKLRYASDSASEMTSVFLGRPSRCLANGLAETLETNKLPVLDFPYQYLSLKDIFDKALTSNRIDLALLELGQLSYLAPEGSVDEIIQGFYKIWREA